MDFGVWAALLIIFIIVEVATAQLVTIWFAIGCIAPMIACVFDAPLWLQIALFVVVSAIALVLTRPIAKKLKKVSHSPTNSDRFIGEEGLVTDSIDNVLAKGRVTVKGADWAARSADDKPIPAGTLITVTDIQGAKLIVCVKENAESDTTNS